MKCNARKGGREGQREEEDAAGRRNQGNVPCYALLRWDGPHHRVKERASAQVALLYLGGYAESVNPESRCGQTRAVALMSGGLDSVLATRLILEQGIRVTGVNFTGGYCPHPRAGKSSAEQAAVMLGIELVRLPIDEGFIELVKAPRYGHGRNLNPCIDCHILMVKRTWEWGREQGAAFVLTGEVLGQRPMSQNKQGLMLVAKRSGAEGYLLRPLCARLLEPTRPEQEGIVDREQLLDIQGRTRRRQLELAAEFGITEFPTPAGGCLLTDVGFAKRMRDALAHGEDSVALVELLRIGRHFRLESGARVIVGRNEAENEELVERCPDGAAVVDGRDLPGPAGLLVPDSEADRVIAARLVARYSARKQEPAVTVKVPGGTLEVEPANPDESSRLMIG